MAVTYRVPGAVLTERTHSVPLDHAKPDGAKIAVFTRELAAPDGLDRPYLLFLQGGPGFEATRPTAPPSGWQKRAIADYRVLLLDQRGTGCSTPVGDIPGSTPQEQAACLTHLRADGIVRDAELIRQQLGVDRWSVLGQSFGGFCAMTYLSFAPSNQSERSSVVALSKSPVHCPLARLSVCLDRRMRRQRQKSSRPKSSPSNRNLIMAGGPLRAAPMASCGLLALADARLISARLDNSWR